MPLIVLDVPFPPSVNSVWRSNRGRVHKSPEYKVWITQAYGHWLEQKAAQAIKSIKGPYSLKIILSPPDARQRDLGNYDKALSDFIQSAGLIENDFLCQDLHLVWGTKEDAPYGARLILGSVDKAER